MSTWPWRKAVAGGCPAACGGTLVLLRSTVAKATYECQSCHAIIHMSR